MDKVNLNKEIAKKYGNTLIADFQKFMEKGETNFNRIKSGY